MVHKLPTALQQTLESARAALQRDPDGELHLGYRRQLWRHLGPTVFDGPRAVFTLGQGRRMRLAYRCANKTLPLWLETSPEVTFPADALALGKAYCASQVPFLETKRALGDYLARLEGDDSGEVCVYAGFAAVHAAWNALSDELLCPETEGFIDEDESSYDPEDWDAANYAAAAYAGGFKWEARSDPPRRREFWRWYLDEALPESFPHVQ